MSKFRYEVIDVHGKIIKGILIEDDIEVAEDVLIAKQYQIIQIKKLFSLTIFNIRSNLNDEQLTAFCGNIGIILDSGVTILRGLEMLVEQAENKKAKTIIKEIYSSVRKGMKLSMAMGKTGVFPDLLVDMISSGEMTSHLVDVLFSMEDFYKREASVKAKIRSASIYPLILIGAAILMVLFFNFFVFSELKILFEDITELPVITNMMLQTIEFVNANPLVIIGIIGGIVISIQILLKIEFIREKYDQVILSIPGLGKVKKHVMTARVSSSMAIFIKAAIPVMDAISVEERLVANMFVSKRIALAKNEIKRGIPISDAFENCEVFDSLMIQMIRVGEETGKLEDMFFRLSDIYEKKSEIGISRLVALIEPTFTLVIGLIIGFVILAMALPIFDLSSLY